MISVPAPLLTRLPVVEAATLPAVTFVPDQVRVPPVVVK